MIFFFEWLHRFKSSFKQSCMSESHYSLDFPECIPGFLRTHARCRWKERTGAFCAGSLGQITHCVVQMHLKDRSSLPVLECLTWPLWCHLCWPACPPCSPSSRRKPGWSLRTPPAEDEGEKHTVRLDEACSATNLQKFVFSVWTL